MIFTTIITPFEPQPVRTIRNIRTDLKTFFFQQMQKLVLLWPSAHCQLMTESNHATEKLLIPQTANFAVSLTLKTRAVTECDLLPPPAL